MDSLLNTYLNMVKMSEHDSRYEAMVFNHETSLRNDFRDGAIKELTKTVYHEKPKCLRKCPPPLKDIQTLTDWKTPYVPFELLVKPKEIVRTDPKKSQEPYVEIEDVDKERVRATRPRLVITPAVSMDDIVDDHQRELLNKEMYATSTTAAMQMGVPAAHEQAANVKAPLPTTLSPANPIALEKPHFAYVAPEWRMESVSWDGRQLRAHCDLSKEFYLARPIP